MIYILPFPVKLFCKQLHGISPFSMKHRFEVQMKKMGLVRYAKTVFVFQKDRKQR